MAMTDLPDITSLISKLSSETQGYLESNAITDPIMVGIHTGGAWIAERLHSSLSITEPLGKLDISFYRDDFTRVGINPQVKPSQLPLSIDDKHILLVDDVLYTGRTIRAALNELFDYGRPASITLIVLLDRNGRELPIQADIVGTHIDLKTNEHIKLQGPEPLVLVKSDSE